MRVSSKDLAIEIEYDNPDEPFFCLCGQQFLEVLPRSFLHIVNVVKKLCERDIAKLWEILWVDSNS